MAIKSQPISYGAIKSVGGGYGSALQSLIAQTQEAEIKAREQQIGQAEKARTYLQQILDIYSAGGAYGKGMEMVLGAQKRQDVSRAEQTDISSGLYGIRSRGAEWESTVGAKARATLEDVRLGRRAQALGGLAQFEAGIEYEQPDYSALMEAIAAGAGMPSGGMTGPETTGGGGAGQLGGYDQTTDGGSTSTSTTGTGVGGGVGIYGVSTQAGPKMDYGAAMGPMFEGAASAEELAKSGDQSAIDTLWRQFKSKNPYYLKGKEYWLKSKGYITASTAGTTGTVTEGGGTFTGAGYTGTY